VSTLERCPSYKEPNKRSKERQGPTVSVRFTEVSIKRELTVHNLSSCGLEKKEKERKKKNGIRFFDAEIRVNFS